ncbi:hypothetical protein R3P38DRAFT_3290522 [Favolaschia claudopus]|uniref:Uncharacterized protein n=1 Tax=Favolaschia claudopus TaxID=2862362 RepID=A0AAV9ZTL3_9AGAR
MAPGQPGLRLDELMNLALKTFYSGHISAASRAIRMKGIQGVGVAHWVGSALEQTRQDYAYTAFAAQLDSAPLIPSPDRGYTRHLALFLAACPRQLIIDHDPRRLYDGLRLPLAADGWRSQQLSDSTRLVSLRWLWGRTRGQDRVSWVFSLGQGRYGDIRLRPSAPAYHAMESWSPTHAPRRVDFRFRERRYSSLGDCCQTRGAISASRGKGVGTVGLRFVEVRRHTTFVPACPTFVPRARPAASAPQTVSAAAAVGFRSQERRYSSLRDRRCQARRAVNRSPFPQPRTSLTLSNLSIFPGARAAVGRHLVYMPVPDYDIGESTTTTGWWITDFDNTSPPPLRFNRMA